MTREDLPAPREGFVLTHYLTASDVDRSRDFYADVLGGLQTFVCRRHDARRPPACGLKVSSVWRQLSREDPHRPPR